MKTQDIPKTYQHQSPAGAEVRLLMNNHLGGMAHCTLKAGTISKAVCHKTVSEFWHVLSGKGAIWRKLHEQETITPLTAGISIDIPLGTQFQYRSNEEDLVFICITMPPWPDHDEVSYVSKGGWVPTSEQDEPHTEKDITYLDQVTSTKNASHFKWGQECDGWWLKNDGNFTVAYEKMPADSAEVKHYHHEIEQFFYCLQGQLIIEFDNHEHLLSEQEGLNIKAGIPHKAKNTSKDSVCFLVISSPNSQQDRINLE